MYAKQLLIPGASMLASSLSLPAVAEERQGQYVQVAEIEIDPAQSESYKAAVKEQIETAIRVEPGVLVLYAVSEKDNPAHIRVLKSIGMRMPTRRIWKQLISRNTRPLQRKWSNRSSLSELSPFCSGRTRGAIALHG
jgi:hypothetical protein